MSTTDELALAAQKWDDAATHEEAMAALNQRDGDVSTYLRNAELYRSVAKGLRMEIDAGEPICHRCFEPYGSAIRMNGEMGHQCRNH